MPDTGIGACVRRKEDRRFLSGKSRYTDDLSRPGLSSAVFLRWLPAHATVASINSDAAVGGSASSQACDGIIDKGKKIAVHLLAAAVEDFSRVINPTIMEDHFHGGIAQGVSQAMLRELSPRRQRAVADRILLELPHAAHRRASVLQDRDHGVSLPAQPPGGEALWQIAELAQAAE